MDAAFSPLLFTLLLTAEKLLWKSFSSYSLLRSVDTRICLVGGGDEGLMSFRHNQGNITVTLPSVESPAKGWAGEKEPTYEARKRR